MTLDLKRLKSAVAVAEEGNLSRAASRLHLSQPALSRRIQELERDLQFSIFEHVGRGIQLTGEGQAFLSKCRDLLAHSEAVEDHARTFASGDSGVLRVGASAQIFEHLFPELLPLAHQDGPVRLGLRRRGPHSALQRGRLRLFHGGRIVGGTS